MYDLYHRDIIIFENNQERQAFTEHMRRNIATFEERLNSSRIEINLAVTNATDDCVEQRRGDGIRKEMRN